MIENILFKVNYPAEFHAQTAAEAAISLHPLVRDRLAQVDRVCVETQQSAMRIINKTGPLHNPADRDHCLQYVVAVGLIHGTLAAEHYLDPAAADPRIDRLRERIAVRENPRYSRDYLDPQMRSIANAVQVFFADGSRTERVEIEYPLGHRRRRAEATASLWRKFEASLTASLSTEKCHALLDLFRAPDRLRQPPSPIS